MKISCCLKFSFMENQPVSTYYRKIILHEDFSKNPRQYKTSINFIRFLKNLVTEHTNFIKSFFLCNLAKFTEILPQEGFDYNIYFIHGLISGGQTNIAFLPTLKR